MAVGQWGADHHRHLRGVEVVGSLGGWMLLVGQSSKAAADDGMFPKIFARVNRHGVPGVGLIIVAVLMTVVLFATMSPTLAEQFNHIVDLAVILIIVPYIYSAVAVVKVVHDHGCSHKQFRELQAHRAARSCLLPVGVLGGDPQDRGARHWWRCSSACRCIPFSFARWRRRGSQACDEARKSNA